MMLSSSMLRRFRFHHLQYKCDCLKVSAGGGTRRPYPIGAGSRRLVVVPIARSLSIGGSRGGAVNYYSLRAFFGGVADDAPHLSRHTYRRSPAIMLSQNSHFSTEEGARKKVDVLIDRTKELPEMYYASPTALLKQFRDGKDQSFVPLESGRKSISINGDEWHTAAFINTLSQECFRSGKFGEFMNELAKNNQTATSFSSEETCVADGEVYYRSENLALEAAAARAIDCIAFRKKYKLLNYAMARDALEPLRYCVELPYIYPIFSGESAAITHDERHHHAPAYYWSCLMQAKYGPINVEFDVQSAPIRSETSGEDIQVEETWYSATCTEPKTGEVFHSGVFRSGIGYSRMPDAPLTPLPLEECRISDGMVYYRDEITAKHAAAAKAIDCFVFREFANNDGFRERNWICMEEPYLASGNGASPINYQDLKEIVDARRRGKSPEFSFADYFGSLQKKRLMKQPTHQLEEALAGKYDWGGTGKMHECSSVETDDGTWYTSAFVDPVTKEVFQSGVVRASKEPSPFHLDKIRVLNGKVYYTKLGYAVNAASARTIDCYSVRDKKSGGDGNTVQLCYEDPYKTLEEGSQQLVDYEVILAQRDRHLAEIPPEIRSADILRKAGSTFSYLAISNPHFLRVPKDFMKRAFLAKHGGVITWGEHAFHIEKKILENRSWFTANFTDPVTHEKFSSGLGREIKAEMRSGSIPKKLLHLAEAKILDGKVYYREQKLAEHAAAARAIDCYIFREDVVEKSDFRLCLEDPYQTADEGTSQIVDYYLLMNQRSLLSAKLEKRAPAIPLKGGDTCSPLANTYPHLLHVPKNFLHNAFTAKYDVVMGKDAFHVEEKYHENRSWFTATFTDPVTHEVFSSGFGREITVERRHGSIPKTPLHLAEAKILDGKVCYSESRLAEHAAAARAIDCYLLREDIVENSGFRLCIEDPYRTAAEGASQSIDYESLMAQRKRLASSPHEKSSDFNSASAVKCKPTRMPEKSLNVPLPSDDVLEAVVPTEDNLPALTLSFATDCRADNTLTTMGRIAEIFTDTVGLDSYIGSSPSWPTELAPEYKKTALDPGAKIESILDWYNQVDSEPENHGEAYALAKLCNKVLLALGKANRELGLDEEESLRDVEDSAKTILDKIITLSMTFGDKSGNVFLNSDTLNAYIHCLSRLDPTRSAKSAEDLLRSMASRENLALPLPNVSTYNAVMSLWALVDGLEGKNGVNEVYSLLEVASLSDVDEQSIRPNMETFKTLLAVNSKVDGHFSFENAKLWLDKVQQISDSICGEVFVPDAEVYYAALTSVSVKFNADSNSNQYADSWLRYGYRYDGGFKGENESSNAEAMDVAKWLLYAEESGVNPSVEMYEAVIQAWAETGAKDGLLMAEEWAKRAVSSSSPIRLETFHPIIAAWALCQVDRAPDRVKEWIKQLTVVSASKPHLTPDLNILSAQIIAWRNVQAGMMERWKESSQSSPNDNSVNIAAGGVDGCRNVEMAFAAAQNCTQYLKELISNGINLDDPQDAVAFNSMFIHTIESWGCASQFAHLHSTSSSALDTSYGVHEMLKIACMFDDKIDEGKSEEHVQHTYCLMGESFAEITSQLHQIDSAVDSPKDTAEDSGSVTNSYFSKKFPNVERMLRDFEHYSRTNLAQGHHFNPGSMYVRHRLYKEILRGCAGVKSPTDHGHVMRVCTLIMDHLSWQDAQFHDTCEDHVEEDITDIYVDIALIAGTAVISPHERMFVLTRIYNTASHFFDESEKKRGGSKYATVDKARLIGAMRLAMGNSELSEDFIRNFDEWPPKKRARGNTAMAFVEELLRDK